MQHLHVLEKKPSALLAGLETLKLIFKPCIEKSGPAQDILPLEAYNTILAPFWGVLLTSETLHSN